MKYAKIPFDLNQKFLFESKKLRNLIFFKIIVHPEHILCFL